MGYKSMITSYLVDNGYGGLFEAGECGCTLDDLMVGGIDCLQEDCEPGYKGYCTPNCNHEDVAEVGDCHVQTTKPAWPLVDPYIAFNHSGVEIEE